MSALEMLNEVLTSAAGNSELSDSLRHDVVWTVVYSLSQFSPN